MIKASPSAAFECRDPTLLEAPDIPLDPPRSLVSETRQSKYVRGDGQSHIWSVLARLWALDQRPSSARLSLR